MELSTELKVTFNKKKDQIDFLNSLEKLDLNIFQSYKDIFDSISTDKVTDFTLQLHCILASLEANQFLKEFLLFVSKNYPKSTVTVTAYDDEEQSSGKIKLNKQGVIKSSGEHFTIYYDPNKKPVKIPDEKELIENEISKFPYQKEVLDGRWKRNVEKSLEAFSNRPWAHVSEFERDYLDLESETDYEQYKAKVYNSEKGLMLGRDYYLLISNNTLQIEENQKLYRIKSFSVESIEGNEIKIAILSVVAGQIRKEAIYLTINNNELIYDDRGGEIMAFDRED